MTLLDYTSDSFLPVLLIASLFISTYKENCLHVFAYTVVIALSAKPFFSL